MSILFTFPGQGAQKNNMLSHLPEHIEVRKVIDQANEILGVSVYELDTEQALKSNRNVQIVMTIAACATFNTLIYEGIKPDYILGLSIGAFPAAICSGIMSFEDGLKLVDLRGSLMQSAYPQGYGMLAIMGLSTPIVQRIVEQMQMIGEEIYIANINTESQTIVSGSYLSLKKIYKLASKQYATSIKFLNVNVPSHCTLLNKQADILFETIKRIKFNQPNITYVSANSARVLLAIEKIKMDLAYNMAQQVHWWETVMMLQQRGVTLTVELPPGGVLTGLCKSSMEGTYCVNFDTSNIENIKTLYHRYK